MLESFYQYFLYLVAPSKVWGAQKVTGRNLCAHGWAYWNDLSYRVITVGCSLWSSWFSIFRSCLLIFTSSPKTFFLLPGWQRCGCWNYVGLSNQHIHIHLISQFSMWFYPLYGELLFYFLQGINLQSSTGIGEGRCLDVHCLGKGLRL